MNKCKHNYIATVVKYLLLVLLACPAYAGLISHSDYQSGGVITAAGQNANENVIFNEFNGNIDNTNIKTGGILDANIAASQITQDKFATSVVSTFTYVFNTGNYIRPQLDFANSSAINAHNNTGVANQTCVFFPDGMRCVTEDLGVTTAIRQLLTSRSTSFSGTHTSGVFTPETIANNTWYSVYAAKDTDDTTGFILSADTTTPTQGHFSALNSAYGTNGWVYLGLFRFGDNRGAANTVMPFEQYGPTTIFTNSNLSNFPGLAISSGSSVSTLIYTYNSGTGAFAIPDQIGFVNILFDGSPGTNGSCSFYANSAGNITIGTIGTGSGIGNSDYLASSLVADKGFKDTCSTTGGMFIQLVGFQDKVLGPGFNPQVN